MAGAGVSGATGLAVPPVQRCTVLHNQDCSVIGGPRIFVGTRFVYCVLSQRAGGLSLGVRVNTDGCCPFNCVYCELEIHRGGQPRGNDPEVIAEELERMLAIIAHDKLRVLPEFEHTPPELLQLREVVICGEGEPTMAPNFAEMVGQLIHVRAHAGHPFFKLVLVTNGTGLNRPEVQRGLRWLSSRDEVWIKLDAGTQAHMDKVNRSRVPLDQVLRNILLLARERPVVIQSLFPLIDREPPSELEIERYLGCLRDLQRQGLEIRHVQIYSAHRSPKHAGCGHLPLKDLSKIARRVREATGLSAGVY